MCQVIQKHDINPTSDTKPAPSTARMETYALQVPNNLGMAWSAMQILAIWCIYLFVASVGSTILAGTSNFTTLEISNASNSITSETSQEPFPYVFPDFARNSADWFPMPDCNGVVLEEATIDELQDAMRGGQLTSVTIVMCYLQRIYQTDEYIKYA